ncbi:MAG: LPS-assembly protein LptD [Synechococcaceae cyanobacterium SM1_2_3]|nr:LPS-assembly protein LptD [Synechococcaceae cyanobacterium SM1_2_3]
MTSHSRKFLIGAVLVLLPLTSVWAQSAGLTERWALCEPDELAQEIVPATANPPPLDEQPLQAEATRLDSSPAESRLEGDAHLSRGDQRLRADRITLDRADNRARADNGFVYGDPRQAVRGKQAEVDLNNETGWFKDVEYYRPERNAQGSAKEARVNQNQQQSQLRDATYSTCPRGKEMWQLRADEINLNEATGRGVATDIVLAFKNTPVFYFPYLSFPINDQRQSGFLFPRQGYDSQSGMDLQMPYYWNIAPNRDMTITPRIIPSAEFCWVWSTGFLKPGIRASSVWNICLMIGAMRAAGVRSMSVIAPRRCQICIPTCVLNTSPMTITCAI